MKYIVAVLILTLCTMTGYKMAERLSAKVGELSAIIYFLKFCENQLIYLQSPVINIIKEFSKEYTCRTLNFIKECVVLCEESDFPSAWNLSLNKSDIHADNDVKQILFDFPNKIGTSDLETQIKYIDYYILTLEDYLEKAKAEEADNKKLYIILGLTIGLIAAIMII